MNTETKEKIIEKLDNLQLKIDAGEEIHHTSEKSFDIYEDDDHLMTSDEDCWMCYTYDLGDGIKLEIVSFLDHRLEYRIYVDDEEVDFCSEIYDRLEYTLNIDKPDIDYNVEHIIDDWCSKHSDYDSYTSFDGYKVIVYRKDNEDIYAKFNRL